MRLSEQYAELVKLREDLNKKLYNIDFRKIKELALEMAQLESYQRHKKTDNQIIALDFFFGMWMRENGDIYNFAHQGNIFDNVNSLEDVERKYLSIQFGIFRIENGMSIEHISEAVDEMIANNVSAYAMLCVVFREAEKKHHEEILLKLARILKQKNELVRAIGLLQASTQEFKENKEMFLELADCWLIAQEIEKASECLQAMENPDEEVTNLITELEAVLKNESI